MKKLSLIMLSLAMLFVLACSDSSPTGNTDDEIKVTAYTLPESIDAIMPGTTTNATQSNVHAINFNVKSTDVEEKCDATGKGAYASATTVIEYENNELLLPFEITNFLLGVLKNGDYASHLNEGTSVSGSGYAMGILTTAKFKVSKESTSDTMLVKMSFTVNNENYMALMKVTKSVSDDLPYGEFETHMYIKESSDNWQLGMKVSEGLILYRQYGGECPNKLRMELKSAKVGQAYFWQDETKAETNGKEKTSYCNFDKSNFFEYRIRTYTTGTSERRCTGQDRNTTNYTGSNYKLYNSDGSLHTGTFEYDNEENTIKYDGSVLSSTKYGNDFYLKNGATVNGYYAKASKFKVGFADISTFSDDAIKAKIDSTMTYNSDFAYKSFDVSNWGL